MSYKYIVVDCESDGPCPGLYSLVCFGAAVVEPNLNQTFYGQTKPISDKWIDEALKVSGYSREQHLSFQEPSITFNSFNDWIRNLNCKPIFVSDNLAYDWQWINYYFHSYLGSNPFGFSGRRIGDIFSGATKDMFFKWKKFRKTRHDHNPVNDAIGNAEAMLKLSSFGIKI